MPDLFSELYRSDNPVTSQEAIAEFDACGSRTRHAEVILASVKSRPGLTAAEHVEHTELSDTQIRKRLSDLKNQGLVTQGAIRRCSVKKRRMVTWWPV